MAHRSGWDGFGSYFPDDTHDVVVVATKLCDDPATALSSHRKASYVDVTPALQEAVSAEVAKIAENRAVIEQAKAC